MGHTSIQVYGIPSAQPEVSLIWQHSLSPLQSLPSLQQAPLASFAKATGVPSCNKAQMQAIPATIKRRLEIRLSEIDILPPLERTPMRIPFSGMGIDLAFEVSGAVRRCGTREYEIRSCRGRPRLKPFFERKRLRDFFGVCETRREIKLRPDECQ